MYRLLKAWILPPASILVVLVVGCLLARRSRAGRALVALSVAALWALSSPWVSWHLLGTLDTLPVGVRDAQMQAIVVLSGDESPGRELGAPTVGPHTLERLRLGARLHRETGLPILVTGGTYDRDEEPAAPRMKRTLETDFRVPVRWVEDRSRTTAENARFSRELLDSEDVNRIYLVSQFWHLPRARDAFEAVGFEVIPVGAGEREGPPFRLHHLAPSAGALDDSTIAIHEWLGRLWYRLRYDS